MEKVILAIAASLGLSLAVHAQPQQQPTIDDYMRRQTEALESIAADLKVTKRLMFNNCLEAFRLPGNPPPAGKPNPY